MNPGQGIVPEHKPHLLPIKAQGLPEGRLSRAAGRALKIGILDDLDRRRDISLRAEGGRRDPQFDAPREAPGPVSGGKRRRGGEEKPPKPAFKSSVHSVMARRAGAVDQDSGVDDAVALLGVIHAGDRSRGGL